MFASVCSNAQCLTWRLYARGAVWMETKSLEFLLADSVCSRSSGFHCSSADLAGRRRGTGQRVARSSVKQRSTAEKGRLIEDVQCMPMFWEMIIGQRQQPLSCACRTFSPTTTRRPAR
jgi:hypothetical protein